MTQFLIRAASVAAGALALAGCASYEPFEATQMEAPRPNFPTRLPDGAATPAPQYDPAAPQARPTTPVQARPLEPAAPSGPGYVTPSTPPEGPRPQPSPAPTYNPFPTSPPPAVIAAPPVRPQAPATRTVTRATVTGKVVEVDAPPKTYTVQKGDNLDGIARKLDTDRKQLADDNKLKSPYALKPGQTLKGPSSKAKAYVVGSGDTLFAVARRFGVTAKALADANDLKPNATIRSGRKLVLPDGYKDKGPIQVKVTVPAPAPAAPPVVVAAPPPAAPPYQRPTQPVVGPTPPPYSRPVQPPATLPPAPQPYSRPTTPQPPAPRPATTTPGRPATPAPTIVPSSGALSDVQISQLGRGRFAWPLRGEVISDFGPKGTGQRNDGLNVRANQGDSVRAAAAGDVVYAGDQVPGFGNLVLIKHTDGWVTAYGHLSRVDVKMQQKVTQGQQIGQAGSSGGAAEPQLHFEVRYAPSPADRARPINPALVLP